MLYHTSADGSAEDAELMQLTENYDSNELKYAATYGM